MIFVYPAFCSESCDKRILPAVCKCMERFFLLQIQDAMTSGVLNVTRRWEGGHYSQFLLEQLNNYNNAYIDYCFLKILFCYVRLSVRNYN